ncbi:MAG TPA: response regulator [Methylocystis sp.]|nr:response regulator [Methylocystis sp.]
MSSVQVEPRPCRVLIVEDDEDDVFLFQRALDHARRAFDCKIACEHARDGLDALYMVSREDLTEALPDAVVLDLNMPRLGGVEFLRSLREALRLKNVPVFVLTTTTAVSIHEEAMRAGADRIFVKPNDAETLAAIAGEIVRSACAEARRA